MIGKLIFMEWTEILGLVGGAFGILALGLTWGNRVVTKKDLERALDQVDEDLRRHINEVYLELSTSINTVIALLREDDNDDQ